MLATLLDFGFASEYFVLKLILCICAYLYCLYGNTEEWKR